MGWASRVNKGSLENIKTPLKLSNRELVKKIRVHIPKSDLDIVDGIFMGMLKGFRPATEEEIAEMQSQGMDLRPPDVRDRERKFAVQQEKPEVEIIRPDREREVQIILTDGE